MDKVTKKEPIEDFISPYLRHPPRTLEEVIRARDLRRAGEHAPPKATQPPETISG